MQGHRAKSRGGLFVLASLEQEAEPAEQQWAGSVHSRWGDVDSAPSPNQGCKEQGLRAGKLWDG